MYTVQSVIDTILAAIPGSTTTDTVDTIKAGQADQPVTGIVTTFLASQAVLQKAAALGANFIITHEPTFYNHLDQVDWLTDDPVYQAKRQFIDDHHLALWRFHDNLHTNQPDPTLAGIVEALGWEAYTTTNDTPLFNIPPCSLHDLAQMVKERLGIRTLRLIGSPDMLCHKVGILVGACGGRFQISFWRKMEADVLIAGEIAEWETSEYARDALIQARAKGLIITGHANSEEAGMKWLVHWLQPKFPDLPIQHVPVGDPFQFV